MTSPGVGSQGWFGSNSDPGERFLNPVESPLVLTDESVSRRRVAADAVDEDRGEGVGERVGVAAGGRARCRPSSRPRGRAARRRPRRGLCAARRARALPEEYPQPLLVATPLADDLLAPLALEVPPLADEYGRHVELLGDHSQVRAQREPDPLSLFRPRR